jgi:MFS superfamily sulfate permease-like transporter
LSVGVTLAGLAGGDPARQAALASLTALIVAAVFALAWLLRLSVLVSFISESILTGFKAGAALVIASTQLPKLSGVKGGGDDFFERVAQLVQQVPDTNLLTLAIGVAALLALVLGEKWLPGRPVALGVVLLALGVASLGHVENNGVKVVGELPAGLPHFQVATASLGTVRVEEIRQLAHLAFACFLLAYIESVSAARTFALKHQYSVDPAARVPGIGGSQSPGRPVAGLSRRGRAVAECRQREGRGTYAVIPVVRSRGYCLGIVVFHEPLPEFARGRARRDCAHCCKRIDRPPRVALPMARQPN